jgi:methylated-DNA-[protein]-cysteine S-methyltransferase
MLAEGNIMYTFVYSTPIGEISITANNDAITALRFGAAVIGEVKETGLIKKAYSQLSEYLAGRRKEFDLPLEPEGTEFQIKVWSALRAIPYGAVRSYKEIAQAVGNEKACRAVGQANNKNPIAIIIPCHRVIGADGGLTGYGGGLGIKEKLLKTERGA